MAITVTITLDEADPRARRILDMLAPAAPADGSPSIPKRVIAALGDGQPRTAGDIRRIVVADGGPSFHPQALTNALQGLKNERRVRLDGRQWRIVR